MKVLAFMLYQDDPFKCTAAKLVKFGLAESVKAIPRNSIVLNPFAGVPLSRNDALAANSLCAIDCSWEQASTTLSGRPLYAIRGLVSRGISRRMPALLASNPINYAKIGKLSTAEALAGSLAILGESEKAFHIMDKFKWGHTFFELNSDLLKDYRNAETPEDVMLVEAEYFPENAKAGLPSRTR